MEHWASRELKERESRHAAQFLRRIGEDHRKWTIKSERERPDLVLVSPSGEVIGLELTELMPENFGPSRRANHRVSEVIKEVVEEFIASIGVPGAEVSGSNRDLPRPRDLQLPDLRTKLRKHLETHGHKPNEHGQLMTETFEHPYGSVRRINQSGKPGVRLRSDFTGSPYPPAVASSNIEIEEIILKRVEEKAKQAEGYCTDYPLWLALRNPCEQRITEVSPECRQRARRLNKNRFARIVLFNYQEHNIDACPPLDSVELL